MKGPLDAEEWNGVLDRLAPLLGNRIMSVTAIGGGEWLHPWHTRARWNAAERRFEARVKPGFVNGRDGFVGVPSPETTNSQPSTINLPLTDFPSLPLTSFRRIGGSANVALGIAGEPVPSFFAALGVRGSTTLTGDALDLGTPTDITEAKLASVDPTTVSAAAQLPERQLKACDIVLRCSRPRTTVQWEITSAATGSIARFFVGSSPSTINNQPSTLYTLHVVTGFTELEPMSDFDLLAGATNDPGYDEVRVCTVYLLSPPDAASDAEIDETWTPYVAHNLFWNARHIVTQPAAIADEPLAINLAGLGGNAQINVNQLLSTNNDAFSAALQFLQARTITGRITTPGHRTPPKWDKALSLDPPFPFVGKA